VPAASALSVVLVVPAAISANPAGVLVSFGAGILSFV
jgi:hypothetical protein